MNPRLREATFQHIIKHPAPANLSAEAAYRYYERLGLLCGTADPTPEQLRIALLEAREYDLEHD